MTVSKVRRCTGCKQVFATPESFRSHKRLGSDCRSVEALIAVGFVRTPRGWQVIPSHKARR